MASWSMPLLIGLGGVVGTLARYGLSIMYQRAALGWPVGTLLANVLGCLAIGVLSELTVARGSALSPELRLALTVGFCGGFTTMSSLIFEVTTMFRAGEYFSALCYGTGTFILSLAGFLLGSAAIRLLVE